MLGRSRTKFIKSPIQFRYNTVQLAFTKLCIDSLENFQTQENNYALI